MQLKNEIELDLNDVLILPKRSTLTTRNLNVEREFIFRHTGKKWTGYPVIAANMLCGTFEMANILSQYNMLTALHKYYTVRELVDFWKNATNIAQGSTFYTMGISKSDIEKYNTVCKELGFKPNMILCDVANGYMEIFVDFIRALRENNPDAIIMAGNVVSGEMTEELILAGADIVKSGIGGGGQCLTRRIAGVGRPQLSTIIDCADHAHGLKGFITSDGGCVEPANVNVAFAGGADFVMLGSMFSGYDECAGEIVEQDDKFYKKFFGMSSNSANEMFSDIQSKYKTSEGRTTLIPCKGPVKNFVEELQGATRSVMTYTGSEKLKELSKRATLVRVNNRMNNAYEKYTIGN